MSVFYWRVNGYATPQACGHALNSAFYNPVQFLIRRYGLIYVFYRFFLVLDKVRALDLAFIKALYEQGGIKAAVIDIRGITRQA